MTMLNGLYIRQLLQINKRKMLFTGLQCKHNIRSSLKSNHRDDMNDWKLINLVSNEIMYNYVIHVIA